jgi:hypothetical protein
LLTSAPMPRVPPVTSAILLMACLLRFARA